MYICGIEAICLRRFCHSVCATVSMIIEKNNGITFGTKLVDFRTLFLYITLVCVCVYVCFTMHTVHYEVA